MNLRLAITLGLVLTLAGCGVSQRLGFNRSEPEAPLPFASRLSTGESSRDFTVAVEARGAGIDAVRESARHPATGHCLLNYGGSDVDWVRDSSGDWQATRGTDGSLIFAGRCTHR